RGHPLRAWRRQRADGRTPRRRECAAPPVGWVTRAATPVRIATAETRVTQPAQAAQVGWVTRHIVEVDRRGAGPDRVGPAVPRRQPISMNAQTAMARPSTIRTGGP